jgi:hypothetical protein
LYLLKQLFGGEVFFALNPWQLMSAPIIPILMGAAVLAVALTLLIARRRHGESAPRRWEDLDALWLAALPIAVAAYFILPDSTAFRGNFVSVRLALVPFLVAALWLARAQVRWFRAAAGFVGPVVAAAFLLGTWGGFRTADGILRAFNRGHWCVAPGATVVAVTNRYAPNLGGRVNYTKHGAGYYVAAEGVVDFTNYEPNYGYFPVQWKDGRAPVKFLSYAADGTPLFALAAARAPIDYILLWNVDPRHDEIANVVPNYECLHCYDHLTIWRRRGYRGGPKG